MEDDPKNFTVPAPGKLFYLGWIIAIVVVVAATAGLVLARELWVGRQTVALTQKAALGPHVLVVPVSRTPSTRVVSLPATTRGFDETDIFAKVPGYLKVLKVDKGDRVKKGELLAIIESPETDKQVLNYRANYLLARITDQRDETLWRADVISKQMYDDQHATMLQAKATLDQYLALQSYEVIRAPFDGMITARNIDPGHLVPEATASTTAADAIVSLARLAPLRVFAYVPQSVATFIHDGDHATVTVPNYPGRKFVGSVTRHPTALAPDSRTMLVEVDLPNTDFALYPGMYGTVRFVVSIPVSAPLVPDDALIFRNNKVYVPVVRNNTLRLAEVSLGYDNGIMVEALSGINYDDVVAVNVGEAARDGERVQPVTSNQTD